MNLIEQLNRARHFAGLKELTNEQSVELAEKKLTGKEKEDFLTKMSGKMDKEKKKTDTSPTKKEKGIDDGKKGPTKDSKKSMDAGSIKPGKGKKKVSEEINETLAAVGADALTDAQAAKLDEAE